MNANDQTSVMDPPQEKSAPPQGGGGKRLYWVGLIVLIVGAVGAYLYFHHASETKAAAADVAAGAGAKGVPVVTATAAASDMSVYLAGLGGVTALNTVTVQSRVSGELIKVAYQEGQLVHQGDLLCEIDPRPYQVELTQYQGALDRDQASLDNAKLTLDRYNQAKDAIPQQTIDTQAATVLQYEGNVKTDQGMVDSANLNLDYCHITSPLTGRVGLRLVDQGTIVATNTTLVVVTQMQPISVIFNVPEDDIPMVQEKLHASQTLQAQAFNRDFSTKLADGQLLALDNQMNSSTGTLQIKAVFPNDKEELFPNQFVNVRLLLDTEHDAVVIPTAAVQIGPQLSFVYVVKADNTIEQRTVVPKPTQGDTLTTATGQKEGDMVTIQSGLAAGEVVVTDGFDKLQQGTKVTVSQPGAKGSASGGKDTTGALKDATSAAQPKAQAQ